MSSQEHEHWCKLARGARDEHMANRVDTWKIAAALIKDLGNSEPADPEDVLALCEFLVGDD